MPTSEPTRGQLERTLSQRIQTLYRNQLGHRPGEITCHIFDKKIAIVLEQVVTPAERLLARAGQEDLAEQIHSDLDKAMQPQLTQLIEEIVEVPVAEVLSDASLETGRTGIIVLLEALPQVREPNPESRFRRQVVSSSEDDER